MDENIPDVAARCHADDLLGRRLDRLGAGWRVLHAVPVGIGGSDIDHVVVGPGGVFTINTKPHEGMRSRLGGGRGFRQPYVRHKGHELARARRMLSAACGFDVPARALVIVVGGSSFTMREQPADGSVRITSPRGAVRWLRRQPTRLTPDGVEHVFAAARLVSTWCDRPD